MGWTEMTARPADLIGDDALTARVPHFAFASWHILALPEYRAMTSGWDAGRVLLSKWVSDCRSHFGRSFDRYAFDLFVADMTGEGASWLFDFAVAIVPRDRATGRVVPVSRNPGERVFDSVVSRPADDEIVRRIAARRRRGLDALLDVMMNQRGVQGSGVSAPVQLGAFPELHVARDANHTWGLTDGFVRNASRLRGEFMRTRHLGGADDPYLECLVTEGKAASA